MKRKRSKPEKLRLTRVKERERSLWRDRKLVPEDPLSVLPSIKAKEVQAQARFSAFEARRVRRTANALSQNNKRPVLVICNARTGAIYKQAMEGISLQVRGKEKRKWLVETIRREPEWVKANKRAKAKAPYDEVKRLRETAIMKAALAGLKSNRLGSFVYAVNDFKIASISVPAEGEAFSQEFAEEKSLRKRFEGMFKRVKPIILFVDVATYNPVPHSFERAKKTFHEFNAIELNRQKKIPLKKISSQKPGEKPSMVLLDPSGKIKGRIEGFEHQPGWQGNLPQVYSKKLQAFNHIQYPEGERRREFSTTRGPMTLNQFVSAIMREESGRATRRQQRT